MNVANGQNLEKKNKNRQELAKEIKWMENDNGF